MNMSMRDMLIEYAKAKSAGDWMRAKRIAQEFKREFGGDIYRCL